MTFYSKLTKELKKQFKTSDILILETQAKCVVVAQRIWEGLHGSDERKSFKDYKGSKRSSKERDYKNSKEKDNSRSKYPLINLRRDQKDYYCLGHRYKDDQNKERNKEQRGSSIEKEVVCFKCNRLGYYANNCSDPKEAKKAKIQSTKETRSQDNR